MVPEEVVTTSEGHSWGRAAFGYWRLGIPTRTIYDAKETCGGYFEFADSSRFFLAYDEWSQGLRWMRDQVPSDIVLDIRARVGRHALHLRERGMDADALGNSPLPLRVATEHGVKNTWLGTVEGVTDQSRTFETVTCLRSISHSLARTEGCRHSSTT